MRHFCCPSTFPTFEDHRIAGNVWGMARIRRSLDKTITRRLRAVQIIESASMSSSRKNSVGDPVSPLCEDQCDHFVARDGKVFAGTHLIIEVVGGKGLGDENRVEKALRDCVAACNATLLHIHTHRFIPDGVSGVAVLAESHISVHTWPSVGYGAFDVFMCGKASPWAAVDVLSSVFQTTDIRVRELLRGEGLVTSGKPAE